MGRLDNRFFPLLLDVIDQSIFTISRAGRITYFNRAAEKVTGYSADEVIGKKCAEVFKTELCDRGCPLQMTIESGQRVVDRRLRIRRKNGRSLPVAITTAVLATKDGHVLGGVEVIKDLSPLHHLKRQLDGRYCFEDIVSKNNEMRQIFELLPMVAQSDSTVLITGASGTGKELVAKAIHHQSTRAKKPFVAVNCAAMPETLMESELFGYVKGAFTDAKRDKPGRIAQADGGTLFLDEVGDLPLQVQVKLLRFLQERAYEPLGATFTTRADVRVISATHRNLTAMVEAGSFRQDLFYRLNVMEISLPPLCDRCEDIPLLVDHFIQRFRGLTGKKIQGIESAAIAALMRYSFPGNIRELENLIERAFILCQGAMIGVQHLPNDVRRQADANGNGANGSGGNGVRGNGTFASGAAATAHSPEAPGGDPLRDAERDAITAALRRNRGNRTRTAAELGIHRSTLIRKIKRYAIRG